MMLENQHIRRAARVLAAAIGRGRVTDAVLFAVVGMLAAACVSQTSSPPSSTVHTQTAGPAWLNCASDAECVLITDPSCHPLSLNRDHVTEVTGRIAARLEGRGELRECSSQAIDYVAVCRAGRCSSTRSGR